MGTFSALSNKNIWHQWILLGGQSRRGEWVDSVLGGNRFDCRAPSLILFLFIYTLASWHEREGHCFKLNTHCAPPWSTRNLQPIPLMLSSNEYLKCNLFPVSWLLLPSSGHWVTMQQGHSKLQPSLSFSLPLKSKTVLSRYRAAVFNWCAMKGPRVCHRNLEHSSRKSLKNLFQVLQLCF